ncbi:MAG: hypothetical protein HY329_10310 [Chloroflexi bacterium]|nr:hypothetical protein [Chloroflexota bacterium]
MSTVVVVAGVTETDRVVEAVARSRGLDVRVYPPSWTACSRLAGARHGQLIVGAADRVIHFGRPDCPVTRLYQDLARALGKRFELVDPDAAGGTTIGPEGAHYNVDRTSMHSEAEESEG